MMTIHGRTTCKQCGHSIADSIAEAAPGLVNFSGPTACPACGHGFEPEDFQADPETTPAQERGKVWARIVEAVEEAGRQVREEEETDGDPYTTTGAAWLLATEAGHRFDLAGQPVGAWHVFKALDSIHHAPGLSLSRLAGCGALEAAAAGMVEGYTDAPDSWPGEALQLAAQWLRELEGLPC